MAASKGNREGRLLGHRAELPSRARKRYSEVSLEGIIWPCASLSFEDREQLDIGSLL